jgi:hypothetical protein
MTETLREEPDQQSSAATERGAARARGAARRIG